MNRMNIELQIFLNTLIITILTKCNKHALKQIKTFTLLNSLQQTIILGYLIFKTKKAVIQFQLANQLKGDGIVGPKTKEMMK